MSRLIAILILISLFQACSGQPTNTQEIYGFWSGIWHGFTLPFSFLGSLFSDNISIYETVNNGAFYNLGFTSGAAIIFGFWGSK